MRFSTAPRFSAADYSDRDAGLDQLPDAVAILRVKRLGLDAIVRKIEAAVGKNAVDVESDETNVAQLIETTAHIRPSRNRSWIFNAPMSVLSSSATSSDVILFSSSRCSASAASTSADVVLQSCA